MPWRVSRPRSWKTQIQRNTRDFHDLCESAARSDRIGTQLALSTASPKGDGAGREEAKALSMAAANQDRGAGTRRESFWLSPCSYKSPDPEPLSPRGEGKTVSPRPPSRAGRPPLGNSLRAASPTARPATRAADPARVFLFFGMLIELRVFLQRARNGKPLFSIVAEHHSISMTRTSITFVCVNPVFSRPPVASK